MKNKNEILRSLPKVDECLLILLPIIEERKVAASIAKKAVQETIDTVRRTILSGEEFRIPENLDEWTDLFLVEIDRLNRDKFRRVINGTGVIIHTNLGRSLLSE